MYLSENKLVTSAPPRTFGTPLYNRGFSFAGGYRYGFNGKENDDEVKGKGHQQNYGFRIYDNRLSRFLSVDPLAGKFPMLTPYQFSSNTPISAVDLDGKEAYIVVFPDYKISTPVGKIGGLGHAGSLIINPKSGDAYYVEYGRYDKAAKGVVRVLNEVHKIGTVHFDEKGLPTKESLSKIMGLVSKEAGHGGRIEAAEIKITDQEFDKMLEYQKAKLKENDDPNRKPYTLESHNCGTFSCAVVSENKDDSGVPCEDDANSRPVKMIKEVQKSATRVSYDPETKEIKRGGDYKDSKEEKDTDKKIDDKKKDDSKKDDKKSQ